MKRHAVRGLLWAGACAVFVGLAFWAGPSIESSEGTPETAPPSAAQADIDDGLARTPEPQRPAPRVARVPEPQRPAPRVARVPEPQRPGPAADLAPGEVEPTMLDLGHGRRIEVAAGELLVRFRASATAADRAAFHARLGTRVVQESAYTDVVRLKVGDDAHLGATLRAARRDAAVAHVGPNHIASAASVDPNPYDGGGVNAPVSPYQWQLVTRGNDWRMGWATRYDAPNVVVAILDTGVAYENHSDADESYVQAPDLAHVDFVAGWDFVNADAHPNDDHQHGTHIAALIASDPRHGSPVDGYAHDVKLMPVKVLDQDKKGTEMMLVEGIYYAVDHGADIINMSLELPAGYFPSPALRGALRHAAAHGVTLIAAAGNGGDDVARYPAASPEVIAIGASCPTMVNGQLELTPCAYSAGGDAVDLYAPGGDISTDANGDGVPDGVLAQTIDPEDHGAIGYWVQAGTSQAAAAATGVAALLLQMGTPPDQLREQLLTGANRGWTYVGLRDVNADYTLFSKATWNRCLTQDHAKLYANPLIGLQDLGEGELAAVVVVEAIDQYQEPLRGALISGAWHGSVAGGASCTTDHEGVCRIQSPPFAATADEPVFVGFDLRYLEPAPESWYCKYPVLPKPFFRMSAQTASDVAAAAEGSGDDWFLAIEVARGDSWAAEVFGTWSLADGIMVRSFGTGMASSSLIAVVNPVFYTRYVPLMAPSRMTLDGSGMASSSFTDASGMASSSVIASGMASSSVIACGMASSSLIWDMDAALIFPSWKQQRFFDTRSATLGTGMASSSLVALESDALKTLDYSDGAVWKDFDANLKSTRYTYEPTDFLAQPIMRGDVLTKGTDYGVGKKVEASQTGAKRFPFAL